MAEKQVSPRLLTLAAVAEAFDSTPSLRAKVELREDAVGPAACVHEYLEPWRRAGCRTTVASPRAGVVFVLLDATEGPQ